MRLVAFCEAAADFRIAAELFDRVLRAGGPDWLDVMLDTAPEEVRLWAAGGEGRAFFEMCGLADRARELKIRVPHGHFNGEPGVADAVMGRTAFEIVRALRRRGEVVDAVVIIRDMDDQPERAIGLEQAHREARSWASFQIVLGCANPKRESWVLCGFEPDDEDERERLRAARQELGFAPNVDAHQLDAANEQAKRSAKRVLRLLTDGDPDREARCWQITPLEMLRERGEATGLREFLAELKQLAIVVARAGA